MSFYIVPLGPVKVILRPLMMASRSNAPPIECLNKTMEGVTRFITRQLERAAYSSLLAAGLITQSANDSRHIAEKTYR